MIQSTDKAKVRFGAVLVAEVRAVLKVSVLFITFPMFWALYDQQVCNKQGTTGKRIQVQTIGILSRARVGPFKPRA